MHTRFIAVALAGLAAGALFVLAAGRADVAAAGTTAASACTQWEVMLAAAPDHVAARDAQEVGKAVVEKAPSGGWEPFGYAPSGQLVYRRCAK